MRPIPSVLALRLAAAAALVTIALCGAGAAQQAAAPPAGAEPVALSDTRAIQDVTSRIQRHRVNLGAGAGGEHAPGTSLPRGNGPWFSVTFANPTSLPVERLLIVRRPLLAGAEWSVGTASALPVGSAVQWVGAGAPEALTALKGAGGAGVFRFVVPAGGTARVAVPGTEGPVVAAVMTPAAYDGSTAFRFVIMGFGFGLLGVLAALSFGRWLGAGDRAAAASAAIGLSAIWVLATQFGHHLNFVEPGSAFDPGLKAAGLFLLAGALLFSVRMQTALSGPLLRVLTWAAPGCAALAAVALPGGPVILAAGPVLLAAALLSLAAAVTDALRQRAGLPVRLPDLASLLVVVLALAAAGALAAAEPSLAADRWSMALHGGLIVALGVLGGSGLILHHGVAHPLLAEFHPPSPEAPEPDIASVNAAAQAMPANDDRARDLKAAIDRGEIRVEFQPLVRLADGAIAAFEALARWEPEGGAPVPPDEFIPLAEESGLIGDLGLRVLDEAVRRLADWQKNYRRGGEPLRMNVNVSARQLSSPEFAQSVLALVRREGVAPESLTVELTESAPLDDEGNARRVMRMLKDGGVRLALDDFGAGHSSLARLRLLPFDDLKLDRSLLAGIGDERGRCILAGIIDLAHELDMRVVAEGVREASDIERLRAMGCDFVQGPFCGPPLAGAAAEGALQCENRQAPTKESVPFSAGSA